MYLIFNTICTCFNFFPISNIKHETKKKKLVKYNMSTTSCILSSSYFNLYLYKNNWKFISFIITIIEILYLPKKWLDSFEKLFRLYYITFVNEWKFQISSLYKIGFSKISFSAYFSDFTQFFDRFTSFL